MTGERNKIIWGEIVARAWRDEAFKQELIANPKKVLSDAGMTVDEGVEVQIIEDTPSTRHLVFPVAPSGAGQSLSEEQLELVAGGGSTGTSTNEVQTAEAATTEVEVLETTTMAIAEVEMEVAAVVAGVIVLI